MRRRGSPYSRIEEVRSSRDEVLGLVLITVILAILLGLVTDSIIDYLQATLTLPWWYAVVIGAGALTLLLIFGASWFFYGHAESQRVTVQLWLPYHFPASGQATIVGKTAYQPPRHARRAFMRRYRKNSPELKAFLDDYNQSQTLGQPFQKYIAHDQLALAQCLTLYVLHRYGEKSLGFESPYDWWKVDMDSSTCSLGVLPVPIRDNPFLRADQLPDQWRLLLPKDVTFQVEESRWVLRHLHYGRVVIRWFPHLAVAGSHSQPYQTLTTNLRVHDDSDIFVIGTRMEAKAYLRWTLLPASEPFHHWATGLLARLEEALDFGYYISTRPDRIIRDLEWKIGWVPEGSSIVEMLQSIEGRLEDLEMDEALAALDEEDEREGESFVA